MPKLRLTDPDGSFDDRARTRDRPTRPLLAPMTSTSALPVADLSDRPVRDSRELEFLFSVPIEAATRQVEAVRSLLSDPRSHDHRDIRSLVDEVLTTVGEETIAEAMDRFATSEAAGEEVADRVRDRIKEQQGILGDQAADRFARAESDRIFRDVLPGLLTRLRSLAGDDPGRIEEIMEEFRPAVEAFVPLVGQEPADEYLREAEAGMAIELIRTAIERTEFYGAAKLLDRYGEALDEGTRLGLADELTQRKESTGNALAEEMQRVTEALKTGRTDAASRLEDLRARVSDGEDTELHRSLEEVDELIRFRAMSPETQESELLRLQSDEDDYARLQRLREERAREAALLLTDPLEAARIKGRIAPVSFTLEDSAIVELGPRIIREAFAARHATGGSLRFMTNRQRDAVAEAFDASDGDGRASQLRNLREAFGTFARDFLREVVPVAPLLAATGAFEVADRGPSARWLLKGADILRDDPGALKGIRRFLRGAVASAVETIGGGRELTDIALAGYAAEASRLGDLSDDVVDPVLLERAMDRLFDDGAVMEVIPLPGAMALRHEISHALA